MPIIILKEILKYLIDMSRHKSHGKIKEVVVIAGRSGALRHPLSKVPQTPIHRFQNERMIFKKIKKYFLTVFSTLDVSENLNIVDQVTASVAKARKAKWNKN